MTRQTITPRAGWRQQVEADGLLFHDQYYTEEAAYRFSTAEIDRIEIATAALFDHCLEVVEHVIGKGLWDEFFIPRSHAEWIARSWREDHPSFYGRMDLAVSADASSIKLLEFNADTPTSLIEAAVVQWRWLEAHQPAADQFNSLHEALIAHLKVCAPDFHGPLHFACAEGSEEDFLTTKYLEDCARQAGLRTTFCYMHEVAVREGGGGFLGADGLPISNIFKLYPWEWMLREEFAPELIAAGDDTLWIEPPWKAILSNKMLLVKLHQMFPQSPYVLPARFGASVAADEVVKPVFSREGANTRIVQGGRVLEETGGEYGAEGFVHQAYVPLPAFDGWHPVVGSWVVGGRPAGMGIRESRELITGNKSQFVPHFFV